MNLYMKQHVFTWGDKFLIYNEAGQEQYYVEGEVFSWGKKLHLYDLQGQELAYIEQKLFTFLPKYSIYRNNIEVAEVVKEFTFLKDEYSVDRLGWQVNGEFFDHTYYIKEHGSTIVSVFKEWMTWGDTYQIEIADHVDEINALAVVLVVDACIEAKQHN